MSACFDLTHSFSGTVLLKSKANERLFTAPKRTAIKMKMIVMRAIVIRAQRDAEKLTRTLMNATQKYALLPAPLPVAFDVDAHAAFEREAANIDRVGSRVLASAISPDTRADDVAAVVNAHLPHRDDAPTEHFERGGLDDVVHPQGHGACNSAIDPARREARSANFAHLDCIGPATTRASTFVRNL